MNPAGIHRRGFLAAAGAAATVRAAAKPLIIDTHLEVWTFDPKFPFIIRSDRI
jgi:hypothetical protein